MGASTATGICLIGDNATPAEPAALFKRRCRSLRLAAWRVSFSCRFRSLGGIGFSSPARLVYVFDFGRDCGLRGAAGLGVVLGSRASLADCCANNSIRLPLFALSAISCCMSNGWIFVRVLIALTLMRERVSSESGV